MSAMTAAIGRLLRIVTARTTCTSTTMAASIRRATSIVRAASQSVASKNNPEKNNYNLLCFYLADSAIGVTFAE